MNKWLTSLVVWFSATAMACGVHQNTGFHLTTEPGSLDVFQQVIDARSNDQFGNLNKPDHFRLFSLKKRLNLPSTHKVDFVIFEAVKGHYSDVVVISSQGESGSTKPSVSISGKQQLPKADELMVISEFDVLDALATNVISWPQAKQQGLVKINGTAEQVAQLDKWFSQIF